jgi:hypothetical protein
MKKLRVIGALGVAVLVLSSCFAMAGFVILDSSLAPGQATKARFSVRPYVPGAGGYRQFFLVGNTSPSDISVGKGVWGANGNFGGPENMEALAALAAALDASGDCSAGGLDFSTVYGSFTWKGYATRDVVGGNVNKTATVDIAFKAKAGAANEVSVNVMGITGAWDDDGDGVPESADDSFYCTGNATTNVWIT